MRLARRLQRLAPANAPQRDPAARLRSAPRDPPAVDHFRSTPPNGSATGQPDRVLPTDLWIPVAPPSDPGGAPFPLVFFVHGSAGLRGQSTFLLEALARQSYNSAYSGGLDQPYR